MAFQDFDLISERRKAERRKKLQRRIAIAVVLILILLIAVGAAVVYFVVMKKDDGHSGKKSGTKSKTKSSSDPGKSGDKSVKALCHGTDFEETCEHTLSKAVEDDASAAKKPKELLRVPMVAAGDELDKAGKKFGDVKQDTPQKMFKWGLRMLGFNFPFSFKC